MEEEIMKLLGRAHDKEFWREVRESDFYKERREFLHQMWEEKCQSDSFEALTYSDFKLFWTTGDRKTYENKYFLRRHQMEFSALLALVYPEEEKYINKVMELIYIICDEYTWCLPAHQGRLEPNNNCKIDLFAAETGFDLAEIYVLLEDRLEPLIKNRIMAETERRIVTPYASVDNYGGFESATNNWTAVCTCSVAAMMMYLYPERVEALLPRFEASMTRFLSGFGDDGVCLEGCSYWSYGFGFFTMYADLIKQFTGGAIDWWKNEKVKTVATFQQKMFLSENAAVSFADGPRRLTYFLWLLHRLKKQYPDDILVYDSKYGGNGIGKFSYQLRQLLWIDEEALENPDPINTPLECYFEKSKWFVKKTESYGFAAKGGHNKEHHNHNDVGSFVFAKDGRQVLVDMGPGRYTRQYFANDTRYGILEPSSRGHSVPIIDGKYQQYGEEFSAKDTAFEKGVFSSDIAGAYGCEGLKSIKRSFAFTEDTVTLTDEFVYSGEGDIVDRIVTLTEPKINAETVEVDGVTITFDPSACKATVNSEVRENGEVCYFIDFKLNFGVRKFACEIK
ncbi:MAG: heparinase II/III family protein [Clostridia bacterium]|nr:heparinase II/III family protein [Clostridia bacterium]